MKKKLLLFFISIWAVGAWAQDFKVVGYLPHYRFAISDQIEYDKLTHLMFAFVNPDIDGNLSIGDRDLAPVINTAKAINPDIRLFISIAGGGRTPELEAAYGKWLLQENRSVFINQLMNYVRTYQLDGIDVDLEWDFVNELYSPFVIELADSLHNENLEISAALPGTYRYPEVSNEALEVFDFINLMSYDLRGPWNPTNPGPHSPYSFAVESIAYWKNQGLTSDRLHLGVPFYGYDFTNLSDVTAFTFWSMILENYDYAWTDQVGERYYNGIPTIRDKTALAMEETAGIMIWELGQDAFDPDRDYSLLRAIDNVINGNITGFEPMALAGPDIDIGPNPFRNELQLICRGDQSIAELHLIDLHGREVSHIETRQSGERLSLRTDRLPAGLYLLHFRLANEFIVKKVIKI